MRRIQRTRAVAAVLGGGKTTYIKDQYTTNFADGFVDATLAEPGPGTRNVIDDTGTLATVGGVLQVTGTGVWGQTQLNYAAADGFSRVAGLTFLIDINISALNATFFVGLTNDNTHNHVAPGGVKIEHSINFANDENFDIYNAAGSDLDVGAWVPATQYRVKILLKAVGAIFYISGGAFGSLGSAWTRLHENSLMTGTPLYPVISSRFAIRADIDNLEIYK